MKHNFRFMIVIDGKAKITHHQTSCTSHEELKCLGIQKRSKKQKGYKGPQGLRQSLPEEFQL
jgi:hypothetical protein